MVLIVMVVVMVVCGRVGVGSACMVVAWCVVVHVMVVV